MPRRAVRYLHKVSGHEVSVPTATVIRPGIVRGPVRIATVSSKAIRLRDTARIEISLQRHIDAVSHLPEALEMFETFGLYVAAATTCNHPGTAYRRLAARDKAERNYQAALEHAERGGSRLERARASEGLGALGTDRGYLGRAETPWSSALSEYGALGENTAAERIRALLSSTDPLS